MENEAKFAVEIYKRKKVEERIDSNGAGIDIRTAEKIQRGASINLNHKDYAVRIVPMVSE